MGTHTIPEKVMAKVDRMFGVPLSDPDAEADRKNNKANTIKALESGKTIYIGAVKLRGVKADKAAMTAPAPSGADVKQDGKTGKDIKDK